MNLLQLLRSQARKYRCPECGHGMADCEITILVQQGSQALVRVVCSSCRDENLLKIVLQTEAISGGAPGEAVVPPEPLFDEERPEVVGPIGVDEVLDLRSALDAWGGDLRSLVGASDEGDPPAGAESTG